MASHQNIRVAVEGDFILGQRDIPFSLNASSVMQSMWRDMEFGDFTLVARGGKELCCHRSVLAVASPVLKGLMAIDMEEGRQSFANIDEKLDDLHALLQYMYIGSLPVEADHSLLLSLLRLSDYYQVPGLWMACASRLGPLVCEANILDVLRVLKLFRGVHKDYEPIFLHVMGLVKQNDMLLALLCDNVVPEKAAAADIPDIFYEETYGEQVIEQGHISLPADTSLFVSVTSDSAAVADIPDTFHEEPYGEQLIKQGNISLPIDTQMPNDNGVVKAHLSDTVDGKQQDSRSNSDRSSEGPAHTMSKDEQLEGQIKKSLVDDQTSKIPKKFLSVKDLCGVSGPSARECKKILGQSTELQRQVLRISNILERRKTPPPDSERFVGLKNRLGQSTLGVSFNPTSPLAAEGSSSHPPSGKGSAESIGHGAAASAPTGPRRKTRRGKAAPKSEKHQPSDQMSVPDTHNS